MRHHRHIFKTRPRTTISSKLPKHNIFGTKSTKTLNYAVRKLCSNSCYVRGIQLCSWTMSIASAKTCDGSDHKQWNHSIMRFRAQVQAPVARPVPCPLSEFIYLHCGMTQLLWNLSHWNQKLNLEELHNTFCYIKSTWSYFLFYSLY